MATLKEVRSKLHAIQNIKKITKTMEMVAGSRLKKAQAKTEMSRPYFAELKKLLSSLVAASDHFAHPLIDKREVKKSCFVIIAGDRGLCGSYNHNLFAAAENALKKFSPEQIELILIGKKAVDHFAAKGWKIGRTLTGWGGKITYSEVKKFAEHLMAEYLNRNLDEVILIYTHYISAISRKVVTEKLLRIENTLEEVSSLENTVIEPNISEILTAILPHYCITKLQSALNEAYASELAARVFSMRAATNNASEMIEHLTLIRNQIRQNTITKELVEITSCADSLK